MAATNHWTRDQLLIAFTLYSQLPFGRLHSRNPDIIRYAALLNRTPSALAMKLVNLASLDPFIIDSGRTGLRGASNADRALWQEMDSNPELFELQCQQAMVSLETGAAETTASPSLFQANESDIPNYHGGERLAQVKTRIGQQLFRKRVLSNYGERCCVTGLEEPTLLVASHIRPWKTAAEHRLNPSNGLCLSSLHDKAFDMGLISFNDSLEMILSPRIKKLKSTISDVNFAQYEGKQIHLPDAYPPDLSQMAYHREHIFLVRG
ncbi:HNH endonuclease [Pectobacterium wasabiae]|uniref:Restriction endonuclease n=1 Tax=Pectobacterium wasabiae TaxID=55208 RepID=A0AAW3ECL8_9GAMM|nr:HNH endonuclease [Pectobacterium wasabiae]AOR63680.1 restriction endonuclease [Pectobacterium wasabiae CFBP 3304]EJS94654.1 putative restriction endonuclease [Pectobacterium wasabiae CFBP 3304]KFX03362.1 restriction endonuclease [Pectobacterium wasabiae]KGA26708.1 restriction endonuclease [Pectobacterium wasabiae]